MIWLTIVVFAVLLLALVLVHEWGHFFAAKKAGCEVEEFGFGFPPRLFGKKWRGTLYSFNLLPLGGFVRIKGEDMSEENPGPTSFAAKNARWRILILSAGVIMNIVLAWVFLSWQGLVGVPTLVTEENQAKLQDFQTYIIAVDQNSPAAAAELKELDRIVRIGTVEQPTLEQVQAETNQNLGQTLAVQVERQGQRLDLEIIPRENPPANEGPLGISLATTGLQKVPWYLAPWEGLKRTGIMLVTIVTQFGIIIGKLFSGAGVGEQLSGPVGIAVYANEVTKLGLAYILEFGALISLNLAIINILPFPALDGGRILFVIIEKLIGRRVPGKVEQITHTVGFSLLILLMIVVTFKDIAKFF